MDAPKSSLHADDFVLEFFGQSSVKLAALNPANGWNSQNINPRILGDVTGDGSADIVAFGNGGVYVATATGGGNFSSATIKLAGFNPSNGWTNDDQFHRELADLNNDGFADIVGFGNPGVLVAIDNGYLL